jgi:20S proteasome alpha/beta subunit
MTIALAMNCIDGIVMLADSSESDGVTKTLADKIWAYQVRQEWGIAIASAGEADLADSFTETLDGILGAESFDENKLLLTLRAAISQTRRTYPDSEFGMLVGICGPPLVMKLYRVADQSMHLGPIRRYEALGVGAQLAKFLCSQMFSEFSMVEEAIRLGIFVISRVSEHVDGCGGPISVLAAKKGTKEWLYEHPEKVVAIQKALESEEFRKHLINYWISKIDNVEKVEHDRYRPLLIGGFPRIHIKVADSKQTATQSTSRKSKRKK